MRSKKGRRHNTAKWRTAARPTAERLPDLRQAAFLPVTSLQVAIALVSYSITLPSSETR